MSNATSIAVPAIAAVAGVALGAALSGYFTIRLKAQERVQERRAEVYVDMLAWIGARMPRLALMQELLNRGATSGDSRSKDSAPDIEITFPDSKSTFPDVAAVDPHTHNTDPGSPFFMTLRARVVAFASHDMARAFDHWTEAYRETLSDSNCIESKAALSDLVLPSTYGRNSREVSGMKHSEIERLAWARKISPVSWIKRRIDPGVPDDNPGTLTRAIENCASSELRKG